MTGGWIKLYRSLLHDPVWTTATSDQKAVLMAILLSASHERRQWVWEGRKFEVQPGQLVTSLASLAKTAGVSIKSVRSAIARFEKLDFLANESAKTGRLISIVNWQAYQSSNDEPGKDVGKHPAKTGQLSRMKEGKKKLPPHSPQGEEDPFPATMFPEAFQQSEEFGRVSADWSRFRREIKKPLKPSTAERQVKVLVGFGVEGAIQSIEQSITNGWTGIFEPKGKAPVNDSFDGRRLF